MQVGAASRLRPLRAILTDAVGASLPTDPFPYLDDLFNGNPGGLGVCQTTTCSGTPDDNIGFAAMGEVLIVEFDSTMTVQCACAECY